MNFMPMEGIGPVDLMYKGADSILRAFEGNMPLDAVHDFFESVTWREPFILGLLAAQVCIWLFAFVTRKGDFAPLLTMAALCATCLNANRLNNLGREHWPKFATQNYFDKGGMFMLIFVLVPFVVLCNIIAVRHVDAIPDVDVRFAISYSFFIVSFRCCFWQ